MVTANPAVITGRVGQNVTIHVATTTQDGKPLPNVRLTCSTAKMFMGLITTDAKGNGALTIGLNSDWAFIGQQQVVNISTDAGVAYGTQIKINVLLTSQTDQMSNDVENGSLATRRTPWLRRLLFESLVGEVAKTMRCPRRG